MQMVVMEEAEKMVEMVRMVQMGRMHTFQMKIMTVLKTWKVVIGFQFQ